MQNYRLKISEMKNNSASISNATPLAPIIIQDETFNLTTSSPLEDNANEGSGHGTGIAALAALGRGLTKKNIEEN